MKRTILFKWFVRVCRYGLVALFLFTAIAKLAIINAFVKNIGELLASSGFDYQRWSWPATIVVIAAEIVTAILLIMPRTVRIGALFAAVLLIGFAGYALYYVYALHGEPLECGCFAASLPASSE